jgi:hypothetical protein
MYIKLINGVPKRYTLTDLRRDNPGTSFPSEISAYALAEYGLLPLQAAPQPAYNNATQRLVEDDPAEQAGTWTQTWKVVPRPLDEVRSEKLAELDRAYDSAIQQPIVYMGHTFQADTDSQDTLTKTLTTLNAVGNVPPGFAWWTADNIAVPMTLAELNGLAMAMLNRGWAAFQNKQAKKEAVRNAQTVDDVNNVVW